MLLVDDDDEIRTLGAIVLRKVGGWAVRVAASGAEALELVRAERPDLILLDVRMPEMDGPATLALLRARPETSATPVIFLTAESGAGELEADRDREVLGVIEKPFEPLGLAAAIRSLLSRSG
ncbi:MAG: response regulator [Nannocystis sp.]|nr:response regulator [Nannocystis sp.]